MNNKANWLVIGRFGRPHGVKGFVTVHSFTEPRDNILGYTNWHAFLGNQWQPIKTLTVEAHSKNLIAQIEGYSDRETVARLTNVEIAVSQDQLAKLAPGEFYWHQLIGMQVIDTKGQVFGSVSEILPTGANDVLVVEGEKRHLIPYLPGLYVINIDEGQRVITVDWEMDF